MSAVRRVYHPRLKSWKDVPAGRVEEWKAAGWRVTPPRHFDPGQAPRLPQQTPAETPGEPDGE